MKDYLLVSITADGGIELLTTARSRLLSSFHVLAQDAMIPEYIDMEIRAMPSEEEDRFSAQLKESPP